MNNRWIQQATKESKKGALHRQLGYSPNEMIPQGLLHDIATANIGTRVRGYTVTRLLKQRAVFAVNAQKRK